MTMRMELLVALDALRRGSARRITAVIPYYGYPPRSEIWTTHAYFGQITCQSDHFSRCGPGADNDLHAGQIQGFFDIPTDNLFAAPVFVSDIKERMMVQN